MVIFLTVMLPFVFGLKRSTYTVYVVALYLMNTDPHYAHIFPLADFPRRMMMALPVFIRVGPVKPLPLGAPSPGFCELYACRWF